MVFKGFPAESENLVYKGVVGPADHIGNSQQHGGQPDHRQDTAADLCAGFAHITDERGCE